MPAVPFPELAAILAVHGGALVASGRPLSASSLEQYWAASRCRIDRWTRQLKLLAKGDQSADQPSRIRQWDAVGPTVEEVLLSDLLTRLWAALAVSHDLRHKTDLAHPVARSIYIAHMEVRNRALQAVLALAADDPDEALHWNRLRHRTDRWLDYLLAYLLDDEAVLEFAANRERALEFHDDLRRSPSDAHRRNAWPLVAASIRAAFPPRRSDAAGNSDLNEQIASSLLAALPAEAFDSVGLFKSLWLVRLENTTADAQGMIERLFREERLDRAPIDSREKAKKRFHL